MMPDNTEESCIVNDESMSLPKNGSAQEKLKVGMSSRVSSKISFKIPKTHFASRLSSRNEQSNLQNQTKSVFSDSVFEGAGFKTMDARKT